MRQIERPRFTFKDLQGRKIGPEPQDEPTTYEGAAQSEAESEPFEAGVAAGFYGRRHEGQRAPVSGHTPRGVREGAQPGRQTS